MVTGLVSCYFMQARRDNAVMVKDLGWLSAAEAEAAAARRGLKSQVEDLQSGLSLEQKARHHAVKQYVDALDAKSTLQLQYQEANQQLDQLKGEHGQLQQQYELLHDQYTKLLGQCQVVSSAEHTSNHAAALPLLFASRCWANGMQVGQCLRSSI